MKWLGGKEVRPEDFTGESLCEALALELFEHPVQDWLCSEEFIQNAAFLIAFDTELAMEGIFCFLENSYGQYAASVIQAFQAIGDFQDAGILTEICHLAPPAYMRTQFLHSVQQEYEILNHADTLPASVAEQIELLENQLYLNTDSDIWPRLYAYLDENLKKQG